MAVRRKRRTRHELGGFVQTQPQGRFCQVTPASGVMPGSELNDITVVCAGSALNWDDGYWDDFRGNSHMR